MITGTSIIEVSGSTGAVPPPEAQLHEWLFGRHEEQCRDHEDQRADDQALVEEVEFECTGRRTQKAGPDEGLRDDHDVVKVDRVAHPADDDDPPHPDQPV